MNQNPLDLASVFVAIFALYIAQPIAHAMGVYTAIIICAVAGSGLALVRAPEMSRWRSGMFVLALTVVTSSVTVGVAELINWKLELPSINPLVSPVALLLSLIGHDWQRVARGAWASVRPERVEMLPVARALVGWRRGQDEGGGAHDGSPSFP